MRTGEAWAPRAQPPAPRVRALREALGGPALPRRRPRPAVRSPLRRQQRPLAAPGRDPPLPRTRDPGAHLHGPFRRAESRRRPGPPRIFPLPSARSGRPAGRAARARRPPPQEARSECATARNFERREAAAAGPPPMPSARAPRAPRWRRGWRRAGSAARAPAPPRPAPPARPARPSGAPCGV